MSLFPRRRIAPLYRDRRLDLLEEQMAERALPGRISGRMMRLATGQLGRQERRGLNLLTRRAGGDPLAVSEGIADINRGTAQAASDAAIQSELAEDKAVGRISERRARIWQSREEAENRQRQLEADAEYQNQLLRFQVISQLLSGAVDVGAAMYGGGRQRRWIEEMLAKGDVPK